MSGFFFLRLTIVYYKIYYLQGMLIRVKEEGMSEEKEAAKKFLAAACDLWPAAKGSLARVARPCGRPNQCAVCRSGQRHPGSSGNVEGSEIRNQNLSRHGTRRPDVRQESRAGTDDRRVAQGAVTGRGRNALTRALHFCTVSNVVDGEDIPPSETTTG